jgi:hypothetical protein
MTLPLYQLPLPAELVKRAMQLQPIFQNTSPARFPDGFTTMADNADPYWELKIDAPYSSIGGLGVGVPSDNIVSRLRAWKAGLRGGQKTFLCPYAIQPYPMAYADQAAVEALTRSGGGAFDGTATIVSFLVPNELRFTSASTLRLPAAFVLKAGDVVSVVKAGARPKYSLHFVVENATSNGSGAVTVVVEPRVNTNIFGSGDIVNFVDPMGEFVLDPTTQTDGLVSRGDNSFQIAATSYLRA